jgi:hypothetical protein
MLSETTGMATTSKNLPVSGIAAILPLAIFVVALVVEINSGINMPQNHNPPRLITSTAFTVGAGSSSYFRFSVPATATNVFVDGHFAATGGASNDIEVYVLNANEFVDFQNHHQTATFYGSQRETQNSISAVLPSGAGTYYLVFNNGFSLLTAKAVQASAVLHYTN